MGSVTAAIHCEWDLALRFCIPHRTQQIQKEPIYTTEESWAQLHANIAWNLVSRSGDPASQQKCPGFNSRPLRRFPLRAPVYPTTNSMCQVHLHPQGDHSQPGRGHKKIQLYVQILQKHKWSFLKACGKLCYGLMKRRLSFFAIMPNITKRTAGKQVKRDLVFLHNLTDLEDFAKKSGQILPKQDVPDFYPKKSADIQLKGGLTKFFLIYIYTHICMCVCVCSF